jgi:hypothetical protein
MGGDFESQEELSRWVSEGGPALADTAEDLIEVLKKLPEPPKDVVPAIVVNDISAQYDSRFMPETAEALKTAFKKVIGPVEPEYKTLFLSAMVKKPEHIPAAADALIKEVEKLALCGVLLGHLAKLSTIKLVESADIRGVISGTSYAVFIFPTVKFSFDASTYGNLFDMRFHTREGAVGQVFEPEGVVFATAAI